MSGLRPILLIEDDPKVLEDTLAALADFQLPNPILVARDEGKAREALRGDSAPGLVLINLRADRPWHAALLAEIAAETRGPGVIALAAPSEREGLRNANPRLEVVARPLRREALLEAVENLGLAWGIVDHAGPRGAYRPPGD